MSIFRYCLDRRILAVLGLVALATAFLAPRTLGAALPLLLVAACPLSMVVMAVAMSRGSTPAAQSSSVEPMRTELMELAERRHRLERELAAADGDRPR